MATYEFRNAVTGDVRTVEASMKSPPPEAIVFVGLTFVGASAEHDLHRAAVDDDSPASIYRRVYTVPRIAIEPDQAVSYKDGPPVSSSLPRRSISGAKEVNYHGAAMFEHKDGEVTDKGGRPVIDSKRAMQRACSRTGFVRDNGAPND